MKICDHLVIVVILEGKVVPSQKFMLFVVIVTTKIRIYKYKSTKKRNRRNTQALIRALICII